MSASQQQLPPFDLQAYISRYDPHSETHLQRLLFLAHRFHDEHQQQHHGGGGGGDDDPSSAAAAIARQAFELAVRRMKQSGNHRRYLEEYGAVDAPAASASPAAAEGGDVRNLELTGSPPSSRPRSHSHSNPSLHPHVVQRYLDYDPDFPRISKLDAASRLETMEARLATAQGHLMKESIRTALLALAEFHRERGELREAWRRVARSREYCANGRQHTQVCLLLVELSVDLREWSSVRDTISRAEHTATGDVEDVLFHQKLRAGRALAHLADGRYLEAARAFASVSPDLTNQFNAVISAEDLATYGSLLGLATLDRAALHELVIDGAFKGRLELVPAMREALRHYSRAEYGQCLALLQTGALRRDLLLDMHLHSHVPVLLDMIRDRCIVQYFRPYSSVSLHKMGTVFGCTVAEMEDVVAKLLMGNNGGGNDVDGMSLGEGARINALEKTLCVEGSKSVERKARRKARARAAKMGVQFSRNAEGMILRVACIENGIVIQSDKRPGWRGRSGRSRDGGRHGVSDRMMSPDGFESDESISDDAMDIDNHMVNPNEF